MWSNFLDVHESDFDLLRLILKVRGSLVTAQL